MSIESFRLSEKEKDQLVKLKRVTGLKNWNVLCRWAFCLSIRETTAPALVQIVSDSTVEMTWKTFGSPYPDIYAALLRQRLLKDGIPLTSENLQAQFRLHLNRGLNYLTSDTDLRSIRALIGFTQSA